MPVLDAHVHVFPPEIIEKRVQIAARDSAFNTLYGDVRARMVDASGVRSYMDNEGVDRVVVVGFCFSDPGLIRLQNDYILETAQADERMVPLVAVSTADAAAAIDEIARCAPKGARGIGELAWYGQGFGRNERLNLSGPAAYAEENGLVVMLHVNEQIGHHYAGKTKTEFDQLSGLIEDHPNCKVLLAHMGGGICFYEFMPEVRKAFSSVYYDCAAVPFLYTDALYTFAARFLPRKVVFGSDYPLLGLKRYAPALDALDASVRQAFLFDNGSRLFGD